MPTAGFFFFVSEKTDAFFFPFVSFVPWPAAFVLLGPHTNDFNLVGGKLATASTDFALRRLRDEKGKKMIN